MTSAPPMPRSPAKNALRNPTPRSVDVSASVTRSVRRARERSVQLPDARPVCGQVAELHDHLRVGLHLGRRPLAGRIVLDRLLEVPGRDPGDDRHGVRRALAAQAVAGAAGERAGGARRVERSGGDGGGEEEQEQEAEEGRHRVLLYIAYIAALSEYVLPTSHGLRVSLLRNRRRMAGTS